MVNVYGRTSCPECGVLNNMYREIAVCKHMPSWDKVKCYACGNRYKHTDVINNVPETEAERVRREGRD